MAQGSARSRWKRHRLVHTGAGPPVAALTSDCNRTACEFDASASLDPDGAITSYVWEFGDGTSGSGATASHTYSTGASYTVMLTVTDNAGATARGP